MGALLLGEMEDGRYLRGVERLERGLRWRGGGWGNSGHEGEERKFGGERGDVEGLVGG